MLAAVLCVALTPLAAFATDTEVATEPTESPIARFVTAGDNATIGWYFTSDSPRRERQIAQTVQIAQDGVAKGLAVELAESALSGMGQDATYELKVYESAKRPDRHFLTRNVVLQQEGTIKDGEGGWLVFPFSEEIQLKGAHFYTFSLRFTTVSSGNRVLLKHSAGESDTQFRWHRSGRDSWVPSPLSLHYVIY